MLVTLVLIGMALVVAEMWRRLNLLQARIDILEGRRAPEPMPAVVSVPAARVVRREAVEAPLPETVQQQPVAPNPPAESVRPEKTDEGVEAPVPKPTAWSLNFEDLFGRRLPIWAGGITLAVAGVLIVKYSIDAGLLSPLVRVICGLLFGAALIGGAELALREEERVRDPRVRQALSGAGIATLYSSILIAANLYELVGPVAAFVGMAVVTVLAMGLSLRFGPPSALLGLVGGLAAPALVGSGEPHVPLLASYLALAVGGLCALSRTQRWMWLGAGALIGGFGWGAILLLGGALDMASSFSIGIFVLLLGIAFPLLAFPEKAPSLLRVAGSVLAAAQMAALVATGGFAMLHWGLFALLALATTWLSVREHAFARLPAISLAVALLLLGTWPDPELGKFVIVSTAMGLIHFAPAVWRLWRSGGSLVEAGMIAALAVGGLIVAMVHYYRLRGSADSAFAALSLALAMAPAGAAALGWRSEERTGDARLALLASSAGILLASAAAFALPAWTIPAFVAAMGMALLLLSFPAGDMRLEYCGWGFAVAGLLLIASDDHSLREAQRLFGEDRAVIADAAFVRWGGPAALAGLFAWRARLPNGRVLAQAAAALLGYAALAQITPIRWLPLVPALGLAALAQWNRSLGRDALLSGMVALVAVTVGWALPPVGGWVGEGLKSLIGVPMLTAGLPSLYDVLTRLLLPALTMFIALWRAGGQLQTLACMGAAVVAAIMGGVALHALYKQIFALASYGDFVRAGFAERTLWEAMLLIASMAAWHFAGRFHGLRRAARALGAAGMAHLAWYTVIQHNPLLTEQAVGGIPLLNLLLPAYGLPLLWLVFAGRHEPAWAERWPRLLPLAQILLILLFCYSSLRQALHGAILTGGGVSAIEDIFRSVMAIALAIGFLLWGIARKGRLWRIASLVLIIVAAVKVFLFDASGLDGLLRIGSFIALGFSLIGIGWLYSRQLRGDTPLTSGT